MKRLTLTLLLMCSMISCTDEPTAPECELPTFDCIGSICNGTNPDGSCVRGKIRCPEKVCRQGAACTKRKHA